MIQTKHKYFLSAKFELYRRLFNTACMGCLRKEKSGKSAAFIQQRIYRIYFLRFISQALDIPDYLVMVKE